MHCYTHIFITHTYTATYAHKKSESHPVSPFSSLASFPISALPSSSPSLLLKHTIPDINLSQFPSPPPDTHTSDYASHVAIFP